MASELNSKSDINFDAVMSFAVHINDVESMAERVPFDSPGSRLEKRWHAAEARRFLGALKGFVERSKFRSFANSQSPLYDTATTRLRSLVESQSDLGWFDKFFGAKPAAQFIVIPALFNGGDNFGVNLRGEDGVEE